MLKRIKGAFQSFKNWINIKRGLGLGVLALILFSILSRGGGASQVPENFVPTYSVQAISTFETQSAFIETSGIVESLAQVDLRSETSAPVRSVYVTIGQSVVKGQTLIEFERADLDAQLAQASAGVDRAYASLQAQKIGAREEDLEQARLAVEQAEASLNQAIASRDQIRIQQDTAIRNIEQNIDNTYESSVQAAAASLDAAIDALVFISDYQKTYFSCLQSICYAIRDPKADAIYSLYGVRDAGFWSTPSILNLSGGVEADITFLESMDEIDGVLVREVLERLESGLTDIATSLDALRSGFSHPVAAGSSAADISATDVKRGAINGSISEVQGTQTALDAAEGGTIGEGEPQSLEDAKQTRDAALRSADSLILVQEAALKSATARLSTIETGARAVDLAPFEASVREAEAAYALLASRLRTVVITAPFDGVVATLPARVGEPVAPGQIIASVVNAAGFEVKTYVSADEARQISVHSRVFVNETEEAVITYISPRIDPATGKVEVRVALTGNADFTIGEFLPVAISIRESSTLAILLPLEAVRFEAGRNLVYTVVDGRAASIEVETGAIRGTAIEVSAVDSSLEILTSARGIEEGQEVTLN
ncbi:MAG: HlyD family efflux transporter periplasmic adaptor subunit [bacterium]|nr:HlyD family efflux transporter periplasmic adaptor subunit [bacterium]